MNKKVKITLAVTGVLLVGFIIMMTVYKMMYSMDVINDVEFGKPEASTKIIIASQGSDFKNKLVAKVTDALKGEDVYILITDTTRIPDAPALDYDAVVLIHTVEAWKLEKHVELYMSKTGDYSNLVLVSTSGSGDWKTDKYDVDTITSASRSEELDPVSSEIVSRVRRILESGDKKTDTAE